MTTYRYECDFCGTKFVQEGRFLKHKCKHMARDEEFRTPIGQAAWIYYQQWMKAYKRLVPRSSSFLHSKFYTPFMNFARFVKQIKLPDTETFIWLMKEKDISPTLWTHDKVYSMYLEFLDRQGDPKRQAEITIHTLFDIADAADCSVDQVFGVLTPNEVIQFLRERRMSPWLLLHSKRFVDFFMNRTSNEEKLIMESIIRPKYWSEKFKKQPDTVKLMKMYVAELNL